MFALSELTRVTRVELPNTLKEYTGPLLGCLYYKTHKKCSWGKLMSRPWWIGIMVTPMWPVHEAGVVWQSGRGWGCMTIRIGTKICGMDRLHSHDDVIKWKNFPRNWPFVRGIHRSRWIPHTKASLVFSLICARMRINNHDIGDLRRHRGHYDVNVMENPVLSALFTPQPSGLEGYCRHGPGGRAGSRACGCQTCGTHISVTAWRIFSIRSSVQLSRPLVVHCHGHLPICPIWACPWAKNLSNQAALGPDFAEAISLKPLYGFIPFEVLWNCLDL